MPEPLVIASIAAPWGPIRLAASDRGLVALDHLAGLDEFRDRLTRRFGRSPTGLEDADSSRPATAVLRDALQAIAAYLAGDATRLARLPIDLSDRPAWDRLVLEAVQGIPPGSTASYGDVARMVGRHGAARAVGGAVSRNPIGLAIPCHRVIAGDGTLGGYGGGWWGGREAGLELKRRLLAHEGVHLADGPAE